MISETTLYSSAYVTNKAVADLAVSDLKKNKLMLKTYKNCCTSLVNQSHNEEVTKLIKYQKLYNQFIAVNSDI